MHSLIEHSSIYSEQTGSLCSYSKDEVTNFDAYVANNNGFKFFEHIRLNYLETLKMMNRMGF